jgi:hypothetical protein
VVFQFWVDKAGYSSLDLAFVDYDNEIYLSLYDELQRITN